MKEKQGPPLGSTNKKWEIKAEKLRIEREHLEEKERKERALRKQIISAVIESLKTPSSFWNKGLSVDVAGRPVGYADNHATQLSADGWILRHSKLAGLNDTQAYSVLNYISKEVRALRDEASIVQVNDDNGREATIKVLEEVLEGYS